MKESRMYSLPQEDLAFIVKQTLGLWPRKKTFLITGGTGFFGRWIVESCALLEQEGRYGNRYIVVTRQEPEVLITKIPCLQRAEFQVLRHDLSVPFNERLVVDYVVHAAADVSAIKAGENGAEPIVRATVNVVDALSGPAARFLYVSSGAVYADQDRPNEAGAVIAPGETSYGSAKRMSEIYVERHLDNFCIARCFAFVGPFADPKMAVMEMLSTKAQGGSVEVRSPTVVRSYMYARDMARVLLALLVGPHYQRLYNLGSDHAVDMETVARRISEIEPPGSIQIHSAGPAASLAGNCYVPTVARLRAEIPNFISVQLEESLLKTYNFLKQGGAA